MTMAKGKDSDMEESGPAENRELLSVGMLLEGNCRPHYRREGRRRCDPDTRNLWDPDGYRMRQRRWGRLKLCAVQKERFFGKVFCG